MDKLQSFEDLFMNLESNIPITWFILNLLITAILSFVLGVIYKKYGKSISNRNYFANNFISISMTTMVIITIVKSSLALSLGLVGALSIIRFRAAIKEPEELAYLFIAIAIGLGLGANQGVITIVGIILIIIMIYLQNTISRETGFSRSFHLIISGQNQFGIEMDNILAILKKYCTSISLKRFDKTSDNFEASFLVDFPQINQFNRINEELIKLDDKISVSFLDNKDVY